MTRHLSSEHVRLSDSLPSPSAITVRVKEGKPNPANGKKALTVSRAELPIFQACDVRLEEAP